MAAMPTCRVCHASAMKASMVALLMTRASAACASSALFKFAGTRTVTAASAHHPAKRAPTSIFTTSPALSTRAPGMPCTTSLFTLMQDDAGKAGPPAACGYPRNEGSAPCATMVARTKASSSAVLTPATTAASAASSAAATTTPERSMAAISSAERRFMAARPLETEVPA